MHGFGSDLMSWLFTQEVARRRDASCMPSICPAMARATKAVAAGSVAELAAATLALMDALGLERGPSRRPFAGRRDLRASGG